MRELALIKVQADPTTRAEVMQLCEVFRARVVDVGPEALVVEITGTADKIDGLWTCCARSACSRWCAPGRSRWCGARRRPTRTGVPLGPTTPDDDVKAA